MRTWNFAHQSRLQSLTSRTTASVCASCTVWIGEYTVVALGVNHSDSHLCWPDSDESLVQERGSISTVQGLALAFPNIYQHRVSSFHLIDPTKPGHRKILAFFLVDPNEPVLSASEIAPQQVEWMSEFMHSSGPNGVRGTYLERLPAELKDLIIAMTDGLMTRQQANETREALIKERSRLVDTYNKYKIQEQFNMCEH